MNKKRLTVARILIVTTLFFPSKASAEIGKSINDFKKCNFYNILRIKHDDSHQVLFDPEPRYIGKTSFNFLGYLDKEQRYRMQLIADKDGKNIILQYLFCPLTKDKQLALNDSIFIFGFVKETSGGKINIDEFTNFMQRVSKLPLDKEYNQIINGYLITIAIFEGWHIYISR
jgi:hypothetical protein